MNQVDVPFNQPDSTIGRLIFKGLDWVESQVLRASDVGESAFFDTSAFPWVHAVEASTAEIIAEVDALLAIRTRLPAVQEISEEIGYITKDDGWKTFMLMGYGVRSRRNEQLCPQTTRALRNIPGLRTAFFSILEPGKHLPPHRGPYNGVLRLHLGLVVPNDRTRCWIRVLDQSRHWEPGKVLVFNDANEHEAHNDTGEVRVVLFVDFLRPCRWPVSWLNRLVVFAARFSPFVRKARRNERAWEQEFDRQSSGA